MGHGCGDLGELKAKSKAGQTKKKNINKNKIKMVIHYGLLFKKMVTVYQLDLIQSKGFIESIVCPQPLLKESTFSQKYQILP